LQGRAALKEGTHLASCARPSTAASCRTMPAAAGARPCLVRPAAAALFLCTHASTCRASLCNMRVHASNLNIAMLVRLVHMRAPQGPLEDAHPRSSSSLQLVVPGAAGHSERGSGSRGGRVQPWQREGALCVSCWREARKKKAVTATLLSLQA